MSIYAQRIFSTNRKLKKEIISKKTSQFYFPFEEIPTKKSFNSLTPLSNPWQSYTFAALDIEGTGAQDKNKEEILEIAAVIIENKQVTEKVFHSLINPQRRFAEHPWVYIKNYEVAQARSFDQVKPELQDFLKNTVLVAHNARVDWRILNLKKAGLKPLAVIDTLAMAKKIYPAPHRLDHLAQRLEINELIMQKGKKIQPHRALYDAHATAFLFLTIMKTLYENLSLNDLMKNYGIKEPVNK